MIAAAKRDRHLSLNHDQAIQCSCLVGGLVGNEPRPFCWRYYPAANGSSNSRWDLATNHLEIQDMADGFVTELSLYCCQEPNCGYKSTTPDGTCDCDFVDDPFLGEVALGNATEALGRIGVTNLTQFSLRDEVLARLGPPTESGGREIHQRLGPVWRWIKYERPTCWLRFDFKASGVLERLTIYPKLELETQL